MTKTLSWTKAVLGQVRKGEAVVHFVVVLIFCTSNNNEFSFDEDIRGIESYDQISLTT